MSLLRLLASSRSQIPVKMPTFGGAKMSNSPLHLLCYVYYTILLFLLRLWQVFVQPRVVALICINQLASSANSFRYYASSKLGCKLNKGGQ